MAWHTMAAPTQVSLLSIGLYNKKIDMNDWSTAGVKVTKKFDQIVRRELPHIIAIRW